MFYLASWGLSAEYLYNIPVERFYMYCHMYIEHKKNEQEHYKKNRSRNPASRRTTDKKPVGMTNPRPN